MPYYQLRQAAAVPTPEEISVSFQKCQFFALAPFAVLVKKNFLDDLGRKAEELWEKPCLLQLPHPVQL